MCYYFKVKSKKLIRPITAQQGFDKVLSRSVDEYLCVGDSKVLEGEVRIAFFPAVTTPPMYPITHLANSMINN